MLTFHCDTRTGFYRQQNCMCLDLSRADSTQVGAPERLIIRRHLKPTFFKLFRPRTELPQFSEGVRPNCGKFSVKFFRVWKPEFTSTNFRLFQWHLKAPNGLAPSGRCPDGLLLSPGWNCLSTFAARPQIVGHVVYCTEISSGTLVIPKFQIYTACHFLKPCFDKNFLARILFIFCSGLLSDAISRSQ
jgi:hypothetical protein